MESERQFSDMSRQRHEFRIERLEREKKALEERRAKARKALKPKVGDANAKQAEIAAALQRVKAKKAAQSVGPLNTSDLTEEQRAKIAEVDRRRSSANGQP